MTGTGAAPELDLEGLRCEIRREYEVVANNPEKGFHFNTGRRHALNLGYLEAWLDGVPRAVVDSFAGTGNPFELGPVREGERVVDVGSGAGIDSLIAARMVGPEGRVVGVDTTPVMIEKARSAAKDVGLAQVEFREGLAESLPVPDGWADLVISNGVVNLCPNKSEVFREIRRVLRPGGRFQIGDILVQKVVPESAKRRIDLWTG